MKVTVEERFWAMVDKSGECWLWTGSKSTRGYGRFWDGERCVQAHRYSFQGDKGPLPKGIHACHHCDTPSCVRPSHLFPGTDADNMRDMASKGRQNFQLRPETRPRGERVGSAKLRDGDAILVQMLALDCIDTHSAIGVVFRIARNTVTQLAGGLRVGHRGPKKVIRALPRGVSRNKNSSWRARIMVAGKERLLGFFDRIEDAVSAREQAESELRRGSANG